MKIKIGYVKKIMREHKMKICQFADYIGCPRSTVSRILRKERKPSVDFVFSVAIAFDLNPQDFVVKNKKKGGNGYEH